MCSHYQKEIRTCSREEDGDSKAIKEELGSHYPGGGSGGQTNVLGMNWNFERKGGGAPNLEVEQGCHLPTASLGVRSGRCPM